MIRLLSGLGSLVFEPCTMSAEIDHLEALLFCQSLFLTGPPSTGEPYDFGRSVACGSSRGQASVV